MKFILEATTQGTLVYLNIYIPQYGYNNSYFHKIKIQQYGDNLDILILS